MVAFARYVAAPAGRSWPGRCSPSSSSPAAAEAAVGLAIIIAIYRQRRTIQVDQLDLMKG